jgi:hypothetical protein
MAIFSVMRIAPLCVSDNFWAKSPEKRARGKGCFSAFAKLRLFFPVPLFCWRGGAVAMLAWRGSRDSRLLRLRVDVPDQPIKMRLERFTAFLRAVTPNVHGGWGHAEITRQFTF